MNRFAFRISHSLWRLLPVSSRRRMMSGVAARLAKKPDKISPSRSGGVVVAGDVHGPNGLAESARIIHATIAAHGLARGFVPLGLPSLVGRNRECVPADAALLAVVNAPILPVGLMRFPRRFIKNRRIIGLWAWELPVVPREWHYGAKFVHEIWAPSPFAAEALESLAPNRVRVVPHPVAAVPLLPAEANREGLGLPKDKVVVTTIFNLASSMVRKNPLGTIAAFKAAFGRSQDYLLVLKISGFEKYQDDLLRIKTAIGNAPNIRLIAKTMSDHDLQSLIASSDIVLSLHRSEGFGLVMAHAMLRGRPVIATNWSGNLAFMDKSCSALVSYKLIPAEDPRGTYEMAGASWAEPDVEDAVSWLRRLAADPALRDRMGQAGRVHARKALGAAPLLQALAANGIS